ncbi:MAG: nickel-dependent lactate racemase [Candidatus Aminicenantes bacterium]|nr:MAG: nickel-dependent lactate racemase [Candidatus Aminicenantes bacterium]
MQDVFFDLGHSGFSVQIPDYADVLRMGKPEALPNPSEAILDALRSPVHSPPLSQIIRNKLRSNPDAEAVIVISDNTRPVPYSGESDILFPIIDKMMRAGLSPKKIFLLVATGTHRAMDDQEFRQMLDPRTLALGLSITNHDSKNRNDMIKVCSTEYGGDIFVNRKYIHSDIKILTGLVESHFMAGVSGGRKSICPGLISEASTYALHSGPILHSHHSRDLVLDKNPVHEEALNVARTVGCDMIVNVTLDSNFKLTGVFAGDLEHAHRKAFDKLCTYAAIPFQHKYDLVITHTGFVGINHYQAAKGALVCVPLIKDEGICILGAHHTDKDPIGSQNYKRMLKLLGGVGPEKFMRSILDSSWTFIPDQWEAQMWARLFKKIPPQNLLYCCLEIPDQDFSWIPGENARTIVQEAQNLQELMNRIISWAVKKQKERLGQNPRVVVLPDGPYGIPVPEGKP